MKYLEQEFKPSMVLNHIISQQYDMILGMDIGHGECVLYLYYKDEKGNWFVKRLQMNQADNATIPTHIHYDENDNISIGNSAKGKNGFISYFKVEPSQWENPADLKGHTFYTLLRDYIRKLVKDTCQFNTNLAETLKTDKLLIAVGCPSSDAWTNDESTSKYKNLISEATGHPLKHISILPESTAAILSVIYGNKSKIDFSKGILIYDAGSSTLDFTFVCVGKIMRVKSLRIGGSNIDEGILNKILNTEANKELLKANGIMDTDDVHPSDRVRILAELRSAKESFYNSGAPEDAVPNSISLHKLDEDGEPIPNQYIQLSYTLNKAFIEDVLCKDTKLIDLGANSGYQNLSWHDCCDRFFQLTKAMTKGYEIGTVILTGGTSFVSDVQEICEKHYGKNFRQEDNPSASVARGLCYAKGLEARASDKLEETKKGMKPALDAYYEEFLSHFSGQLFAITSDVIGDAIKDLDDGKSHWVKELVTTAENAVQNNQKLQADIANKMEALYQQYGQNAVDSITSRVNELSQEIYQTELKDAPTLDGATPGAVPALNTKIKIRNLITGLMFDSLYGSILWLLAAIAAAFGQLHIAAGLAAAAVGIQGAQALIQKTLNKLNAPLPARKCHKIIEGFTDFEAVDKQYRKQKKKLMKTLRADAQLRAAYDSMTEEQFEIALGKILLLVFDK